MKDEKTDVIFLKKWWFWIIVLVIVLFFVLCLVKIILYNSNKKTEAETTASETATVMTEETATVATTAPATDPTEPPSKYVEKIIIYTEITRTEKPTTRTIRPYTTIQRKTGTTAKPTTERDPLATLPERTTVISRGQGWGK